MSDLLEQQYLAESVRTCVDDPLRFVQLMFPWSEPGLLKDYPGPDTWQRGFLVWLGEEVKRRGFDGIHAVPPIRGSVSSGHGIGKSTMVGWVVLWIMSTRPMAQGTVTANTFTQLQTKTWASIQKWHKLSLTRDWFVCTSERLYHPDHKESWFCSAQSCKEENSEAFAGQHAATSSSFYIFDEASAIPDKIFEVAEGGLTDGEPMIFQFGNPTRSSGAFHRSTFGTMRDRWRATVVDSRESSLTNKRQIAEWAEDYGEDSDFFRVRVRGLPPNASDLQFIPADVVSAAQRRDGTAFSDDLLVAGLDVARGGSDDCAVRFRRGYDARGIAPIRIPGEEVRDSMRLITVCADLLGREYDGQKIHTLFVDGTAIGGPICDRLRQMGHRNVVEVQFGARSPDEKYANMRAWMWAKLRDWLQYGAIDKDPRLELDLTSPGYHHDRHDRLVLESKEDMKKRGVDSPDDGDALALTFAASVARTIRRDASMPVSRMGSDSPDSLGWMV